MQKNKPDIIVINPDQMRADALHHLGNAAAHTPNLDALASEGVSFANAFCQNPVCVPSRCSFMTGLYPHTAGHRTMSYLLRPGEKNLCELLKKSGYFTWMSGRGDCFAGQEKKWLRQCTDKIYNKCGRDRIRDEGRGEPGSARYLSFYRGEVFTDNKDGVCHDNDWQWTTGFEELIKNAKGDKPIFAFLGLSNPHPPYRAEKKYLDLIDESKLAPRVGACAESDGKPSMEYALREELGLSDWGEENFAKLRKTYLAMCARVDDMVGRVIKALKDSGRYDNAAIFFFSDHGDFTGDYSIPEKAQNLFSDCLTRVPLIIKPPKGFKVSPGVNSNLAELIDFYATAADFAGVQPDHTQFGVSLVDCIADRSRAAREYAFCEGGRLKSERHCTEQVENYFGVEANEYAPRIGVQQRDGAEHTKAVMIRSAQHKYVMRLYEQDEFYDLAVGEHKNEINNPAYAENIKAMRERLLTWYMETGDTVPFDGDARFPDEFYLESANALAHIRVSPLIKGAMALTRSDFSTLVNRCIKLLKIDTKKMYK